MPLRLATYALIPISTLLLAGFGPACLGAPKIEIREFRLQPMALARGESFTLSVKAVAEGIALGSFVVRTAEEVKRETKIPGFPLYTNGHYYVADQGTCFLRDNGPLDEAPDAGSFSLRLSTQGWGEGRWHFAIFASSRPAAGPFVAARHDFAVTVTGEKVALEDLGGSSIARSVAIREFRSTPARVRPGEPVDLSFTCDPRLVSSLQLTNAYYIGADDTLAGFTYDAAGKKSRYPIARPVEDSAAPLRVRLETRAWPPGAHHLVLQALGPTGRAVDERAFAVAVRGPRDRLQVTVEPSTFLAAGTHFNRFLKLRDGSLLTEGQRSIDAGRRWEPGAHFGNGAEQLRDGSILGLDYRCLPIDDKPGWYQVPGFFSKDGRRFEQKPVKMLVPEAKAAQGHALHRGPLFMRSILERQDGSLVALMAGWFKSDTALCPYGRGRPYSRTYVCESSDRGATWRYLSTIGYEHVGSEGFNEASMKRLPDGTWLTVMRSGSESDLHCQDNPIMRSASRDEGRTWSRPERTGLEGCFPSLAVLNDGRLAMSYGRPGAMLAFSADGGRSWTDVSCVDATPYSGYTDVVEIGPGSLLVGFGAKGYLDEPIAQRRDELRLAVVRYRAGE